MVNLVTEELAFATDYCGVRSGRDVDKFKEMKLNPPGVKVCKLPGNRRKSCEPGMPRHTDPPSGSHDMFLAEVVGVTADEAYMDENGVKV